jgi:hypothetical protein
LLKRTPVAAAQARLQQAITVITKKLLQVKAIHTWAAKKPPEGCETWSFQPAPADCRIEGVEHRLEQVNFALWARTPLTTIVHSHTGRRIVIHPALGA